MNPWRHQNPAAVSLRDVYICLAPDGAMRFCAKTADAFGNASTNPGLIDGRMLTLHHVNSPRDVHYPAWEMHPEGDELLLLASGYLLVECREGEMEWTTPLSPRSAFIVAAGIWHRLVVREPSVLIAITPRHNTVHEKG